MSKKPGAVHEQVHLAVRLALAAEMTHDERQLVVLDDTLVYTDAGRFARVMAIFEEEAQQRLQFVLLTCHPERYRGLGSAEFLDLKAFAG